MRTLRLAGILVLLAGALAGYTIFRLARPYRGFSGVTYLEFARGTPTSEMGGRLAAAGVVESRFDFWLARLMTRGRSLQAGEYRFAGPASALEVVRRIARGDVFYYELVVPEGKNMFDIAAAVEQLGVFSASAFLAAARNPALIRDLDPAAPSLEGYLFPNTYRLNHSTTPERLCRMMTGKFREEWKRLASGRNVHRTVTLASLIEKEGKLPEERPVIAAVFENRLRLGMKLDCDPTTIYAALLEGRYRGTIYRSDLASDQAYNTYRHAGLPPGPIANPGVESLKAVLAPAESEALYFVRRPGDSGAHEFSKNIAQHEAATAKYRRGLQR